MSSHDDERIPETESKGDLDPPRRPPPTAVGAGIPALRSLIRGVRRAVRRGQDV